MKVLYISNIATKEGITNFSMATQIACQDLGIEFHIAKNFSKTQINERGALEKKHNISIHHIDFVRNPFHPANIKAIYQIIQLIKKEQFDIVHCNTPVGGVCGRIAANICKVPIIIYQSHGFHFYKGAPLFNWLIYYPAERLLAHMTDYLLTINSEDYHNAQKFQLRKGGKVFPTLGVGLNVKKFAECNVNKEEHKRKLGIPAEAIILLTVGEVAKHKNQKILVEALSEIHNDNIYLLICGEGNEEQKLKLFCKKLQVENRVIFLGRRTDIAELCNISDIFCFPSKREGMGIAPLEGMAAGLPLISSNVQGIKDYSVNGKTGYCLNYNDKEGFRNAIETLAEDSILRKRYGDYNKKMVWKYDRTECVKRYKDIYQRIMEEKCR